MVYFTQNSLSILVLIFSELKLLKVKDFASLIKLLFMFDFINENVPEKMEIIFVMNRSIHSN